MERNIIETGVETDSPIESGIEQEHEVYAFADDGEFATVWGVDRVDDTTVEVTYYRCEAGLVEQDGQSEQFDVDGMTDASKFAGEVVNDDPEHALELAREYWGAEE